VCLGDVRKSKWVEVLYRGGRSHIAGETQRRRWNILSSDRRDARRNVAQKGLKNCKYLNTYRKIYCYILHLLIFCNTIINNFLKIKTHLSLYKITLLVLIFIRKNIIKFKQKTTLFDWIHIIFYSKSNDNLLLFEANKLIESSICWLKKC
jgi:hypothetical protein